MVNTKSCPCGNTTDSNNEETTHPSYTDLSYVEMVVAVTVGAIALLTFMLAIWLIVRRRRKLKKIVREKQITPTQLASTGRPINMYSGSLNDLRSIEWNREKLHLTKENFNSSSHVFDHHGDHNNTILNTLSATWSIQTLPNPPLPGDWVINKATRNPLYCKPFASQPRKCVSNNALYESVDNLFQGKRHNCSRHFPSSPAYESIDELKDKSSTSNLKPKQISHYKRVDLFRSQQWDPCSSERH